MVSIKSKIVVNKNELLKGGVSQFLVGGVDNSIAGWYHTSVKEVLSEAGFQADIHYNADVQARIINENNQHIIMEVWADWFGIESEDYTEDIQKKIIDKLVSNKIIESAELSNGMPEDVFQQQLLGCANMLKNLGASDEEAQNIIGDINLFSRSIGWV